MVLVGFVMAMTAPIELLFAIKLGLSTAEVTAFVVVSAVGVIAIDVLGTRAITRIDARATITAGLILFAASEACFALSHGAAGLFGVVDGIALSAPPVLVVALSPNASAGVATYRISCGVGSFLGAGSVNLLIAVLGAAGGLAVVSGVLAVGVVLARSTGRRITANNPHDDTG